MKLNVREWGTGDRTAVLIHGITSDSGTGGGLAREQVVAANPRWPAEDIEAKLEALSRWDPDTVPGVLNGASRDYTPARPIVPSLVQLADPSDLVPPEKAERLRDAGFEVRVVPGAGHSIHRDDYVGFIAGLVGWL